MKGRLSSKFNTATLVLIPAAVGINYLGKLFAETLKLPLWLDSIGTCLVAILAGPIAGAIGGAVNNIIYGFTMSPITTIYALTSIGIGFTVGFFTHKGFMKNMKGAVITSLAVVLVAILISTPLNVILWGGTTSNVWGDALFAWCVSRGFPVWLASFFDELVVDTPDKILVVVLSFLIYKSLPKSLISIYQKDEKLESLD